MKTHGPNDYIAPDYANDLEARVAELEAALTAIKARTVQSPKGALSDDVYDIARAALKGQA